MKRFAEGAAALGIREGRSRGASTRCAWPVRSGDGALRLTLTRGSGARGLRIPEHPQPVLFGAATPGGFEFIFSNLALATTPIRRNETSPSSRIKTLAYLDAILANRAAQTKGAEEALFENTWGHVACAASGNLFALFGTRLMTPPLEDGVLPGTIRALILAQAKACGLEPAEESLPLAIWLKADAIFVTNSLRLLAPCRAIDGQAFASAAHPAVIKLQEALRAAVVAECGGF